MSEFNVGDKVICIGMDPGYSNKLIVGQTYTITSIGGQLWIKVKENNGVNSYSTIYFKRSLTHDSIEHLIKLANEGRQAADKLLSKYAHKVVVENGVYILKDDI